MRGSKQRKRILYSNYESWVLENANGTSYRECLRIRAYLTVEDETQVLISINHKCTKTEDERKNQSGKGRR
jgi:hypothetical protein